MNFADLLLISILTPPANVKTLHFPIPQRYHGRAGQFLESIKLGPVPRKLSRQYTNGMPASVLRLARTGNISRALTSAERRELKALFLWAAVHDRLRHSTDDHYILLEAPVYRLLVKEFPAASAAWEEWQQADLFVIAYVLEHNLTEKQAWTWRHDEDAKHATSPGPR